MHQISDLFQHDCVHFFIHVGLCPQEIDRSATCHKNIHSLMYFTGTILHVSTIYLMKAD